MYSAELIQRVHQELQDINPSVAVILGGSYAGRDATSESDLDFYALFDWWHFVDYATFKKRVQNIQDAYLDTRLHVMVAPRSLFERGFYYINGYTASGRPFQSLFNPHLNARTTLKLALLHYFYFLSSADTSQRAVSLAKMAQRAASLYCADQQLFTFEPLFSKVELVAHLSPGTNVLEKSFIRALTLGTHTTLNTSTEELDAVGRVLYDFCKKYFDEHKEQYFGFSAISYGMYLLQALRGSRLFLLSNPDTMILTELFSMLQYPTHDLVKHRVYLEKHIFPALII